MSKQYCIWRNFTLNIHWKVTTQADIWSWESKLGLQSPTWHVSNPQSFRWCGIKRSLTQGSVNRAVFKRLSKNQYQRNYAELSKGEKRGRWTKKIPRIFLWLAQSAGKIAPTRCDWLWFCHWLKNRHDIFRPIRNRYKRNCEVTIYSYFENNSNMNLDHNEIHRKKRTFLKRKLKI